MDRHTAEKVRDAQRGAAAEAATTVREGQTESKTTQQEKAARAPRAKDPAVEVAEQALIAAKGAAKAKREAERASKPKSEPRPTCTATKGNGDPCTAKAKQGQTTCVDHTPAYDRLSNEEVLAFSEWLTLGKEVDWHEGQTRRVANELGWHRVKALIAGEGKGGGQ